MACYGRLCTRFYDADKPSAPPGELDYYREALGGVRGPVLEPMCGSGRFLIPLLNLGYDLYGFDASSALVEACRKKIQASDRVQVATFESFRSRRTYQACILPAGSFSLLADPLSALSALRCLHGILAAEGICHLEICGRDGQASNGTTIQAKAVRSERDTVLTVITQSRYEAELGIEDIFCHYLESSERQILASESECYRLRRYTRDEFSSAAKASGFQVVSYRPQAFNDSRSIYVLRPN